jgi:hypothetical protein
MADLMADLIQSLPVSPSDNAGIPMAGDPGHLAQENEFQSMLQQPDRFDAQSAPRVGGTVSNVLSSIDQDARIMRSTPERPNPLAAGDPAAVTPPQPAPPAAGAEGTEKKIDELKALVDQTKNDFIESTAAQIRLQMVFTTAQTGVRSADNIMKGT